VAVGVTGAGLALAASLTRPFTVGADVVTAVPLTIVFVVTLITVVPRRKGDGGADPAPAPASAPTPSRGWLWWLAPIFAVTGWELYCYVSLPRVDHPTLSALIDMLDGTHLGKFMAFVLWLALGWFLVRP
jgi:hypothetical protein